ncbi:MAG: hypothetical protein EU536_01570 [Promethearchaeota archaeon]|nr:MAG: hypothetical protein EU536_01570 [Candidatus Lokiarchaeota archaeon]
MPRQMKLFPQDERAAKESIQKQKVLDALKEQEREERDLDYERKKQAKLNRRPKSEFYQCDCGIRLHWRVAFGHRSGCPQCHKPISLSDIFE